MDTIFAQATATGRAGVSVIRLSGLQAFDIANNFCSSRLLAEWDCGRFWGVMVRL